MPTGRLVLCSSIAVASLAAGAAFLVPVEPVDGGGVTLEGWWLAQAGLALGLALLALVRPAWRRPALLSSAFVLGMAGQLGLTWPLWLQYVEMRPSQLLDGLRPLACAALAVQALVVLPMLVRRRRDYVPALRSLISRRVLIIGGVVFLFAAAHASIFYANRSDPRWLLGYVGQIVVVASLFCLNVAHVLLIARALPIAALRSIATLATRRVSVPGCATAPTTLDRRLPYLAAGFLLVISTAAAVFVFERAPHLTDEVAYVFQARQLAEGRLSSPPPPEPEAFEVPFVTVEDGRRIVTTNPGWAGVLAAGVLAGAPWLVNPLLAALAILLLHSLVRRLADRGTAHLAVILAATSPWLIFLAASYMTHVLVLVLALAGMRLLVAAADRGTAWLALAAGLPFGYAVLVRPLEGLVVGFVGGLWLLFGARGSWKLIGAYAVGCVALSIWIFPYNEHLTGSALLDPMTAYTDRIWGAGSNSFGFGPEIGRSWGNMDVFPGHGPFDVLFNTNQNVYNLNFELHGWALGSLLLALVHLLFGARDRVDRWFLVFTLVLIATMSCYWYSGGPDFGARYWFLLIVPLLFWSARGVRTLTTLAQDRWSDAAAGARIGLVLALLLFLSLTSFGTWRAVARYHDYRGGHGDYAALKRDGAFGRALVLVESGGESDFGSAFFLNDPLYAEDEPVFARSTSPEADARLRAAFPGRPVVRVRGRKGPGDRVRILTPKGAAQ